MDQLMKQLFKTLLQKISPDILVKLFLRRMHLFILEINNRITELQGTSMLLSFMWGGDLFVFQTVWQLGKKTVGGGEMDFHSVLFFWSNKRKTDVLFTI